MYETLAMIKPGSHFSFDALQKIVNEVVSKGNAVASRNAVVSREGNVICLSHGPAFLEIGHSCEGHVLEESNEASLEFKIPCEGCSERLEISGDDPNMVFFNDYLIICQHLEETGNFVIFDTQECKLLFSED